MVTFSNPQNLTTLQEATRTSIDGTEYVRLATTGANWKATLTDIMTAVGGRPGGSGTQIQYRFSASAFGGMAGTSWDNTNQILSVTGYALTSDSIVTSSATALSLASSHNGKVLTLTSTQAVTLTCPTGLGAGFSCVAIQMGAGQVNVAAGGGATLNSFSALTHLAGQYAAGTIIAPTANNFVLTGQTA